MVEEGYVPEPTVEIDSEGASKTKEVPCTTSSSGDSTLAESILVADDPTNETPRPSHDHESQQVLPSRMDIINKARNQSGLMNETSVSYLQDTTRSKTAENYDHGWRRWQLWCTQQVPQVDPTEYNQTNVLNFLVAHQRFSVSHLNSFRSSIASVFRVLYPEHMPIANQEQIQAFFATKRRSEVHIPSTSQLETWDTDKMVLFLLSTWADSSLLSLYDLQLKTIALLCLATMARPRSDIGRLQHRDIIFTFQDCSTSSSSALTGVTIHFRKPKETQVKTSKFGVLQDTRLCPASTLHLFIQKTNHLRESLPVDHILFLAYIDKPAQVSSIRPSTLSNWVKLLMDKSGVDTTKFKAHSIRSASSTKAIEKGHSIPEVKKHANWSLNSNTFENFYYKPRHQDHSSTAINHSIFSQPENTITFADGVEPTEIVLGTTNNPYVGETKSKNVIDAHPWYRRFF